MLQKRIVTLEKSICGNLAFSLGESNNKAKLRSNVQFLTTELHALRALSFRTRVSAALGHFSLEVLVIEE